MAWLRWAPLWRSENRISGKMEYLIGEGGELPMFNTRRECREYINSRFGYIKDRADLKCEPHGWKMPIPVRVQIVRAG